MPHSVSPPANPLLAEDYQEFVSQPICSIDCYDDAQCLEDNGNEDNYSLVTSGECHKGYNMAGGYSFTIIASRGMVM